MDVKALFKLSEHRTTVRQEFRAGLTTFLAMCYILFVNPSILSEAIQVPGANVAAQLMTVTALAAAIGSLAMGLLANHPYALAPGMGLNAYFTYSVCLGQGVPWQTALGAVFLSGCLFLVISVTGVRRALIDAIPRALKYATTAGIGCFLAFIGLKNGGLVIDHPVTLVTMSSLHEPDALICLFGLILTLVLLAFEVRGAILFGIIGAALLAILTKSPVFAGQAFTGFEQGVVAMPIMPTDLVGALDISGALGLGVLGIVFTFLFVDFFDTAGTLIALSEKAGHTDELGNMTQATAAFSADGLATAVGALLGTSSTTSYIESAAGISEGGKTGLTSVFVAALFLASLFFWPIIGLIPAAATAPALIAIGAMMMFTTVHIPWNDHRDAVPCLLTILGMPLTFSITNGISLGILSYCLVYLLTGRARLVHPLMYLIGFLLLLRFVFMGGA